MQEKVDGQFQGACALFWNDDGLNSGNNRVCFSPDKRTLYVGQTSRGWGNWAEGVQRITWQGELVFDVLKMTLTASEFQLEFTQAIDDDLVTAENFAMKSYHYQDSTAYGGDKLNETDVPISQIKRIDEKTIKLEIDDLKAGGQVYELKAAITCRRSSLFCYTINRLHPK